MNDDDHSFEHDFDARPGGLHGPGDGLGGGVVTPHRVEGDERQVSVDLESLSTLVVAAVRAGPMRAPWRLALRTCRQ